MSGQLIHHYGLAGLESCPLHNSDCRIYAVNSLKKLAAHPINIKVGSQVQLMEEGLKIHVRTLSQFPK